MSHRRPSASGSYVLLIERTALQELVTVEADGAGRSRPAGFWRGSAFYRILRILERRVERGESYFRVLADRGCFDLRRLSQIDPWTWKVRERWQLDAELAAIRVGRPVR
jgi:hypothetical protein